MHRNNATLAVNPEGDGDGTTMRRVFTIFGIVCAVIVVLLAVAIAWVALKGRRLDRESKAYADKAIVAIISNWNEQALLRRGSPELIKATAGGGLDGFFMYCRRLGSMTAYHGARGQSNIMYTLNNGEVVTAAYVAEADFQHGRAEIRLSLIKHGGHWEILGFRVDNIKFVKGTSLSLYAEHYRPAA